MRILLIDNGTSTLDKLKELIPGEEIVRQPNDITAHDPEGFDLIILSGSKDHTVRFDRSYFDAEINLIERSQIPIIGICLGCELIGVAFGGSLKLLDERHLGIRKIDLLENGSTKQRSVNVYEAHRWIIDVVPQDIEVLATSPAGPEMIRHRSRLIWGLQFHPENFVDQTEGDELFMDIFSSATRK